MTSAATTTMMMIGTRTTIASFVVEETVIGSESFPGMGPAALCPLSMYWSTRVGVSGVMASVSLFRAQPVKLAAYQVVPNAGGPGTETEYRLLLSANAAATGVHVFPLSVLCSTTTISCASRAVPVTVTAWPSIGVPLRAMGAGGVNCTL